MCSISEPSLCLSSLFALVLVLVIVLDIVLVIAA